jgi:PAS domain-containing protein
MFRPFDPKFHVRTGASEPRVQGHKSSRRVHHSRLEMLRSWPIWEEPRHFDLSHILNCAVIDLIEPAHVGDLAVHHAGLWQCDLANDALTWSGGVYDIFGLERDLPVSRDKAVAHYSEESRASLERLRSYAIRHKRGFTIDVEIHAAAVGQRRSVRVIAAPVCEDGRVVLLHGLKLII